MNTPAPEKPVICPAPPLDVSGTATQTGATSVPETPKVVTPEVKAEPKPKIKLPTEMTDEEFAVMTDEEIDAYARKLAAAGVDPSTYSLKESARPAAPGPLAATDEKVAPAVSDIKAREEAKSRG